MRAITRIATHGSEVERAEADASGERLPFGAGVDDHRVVRFWGSFHGAELVLVTA